MKNQRMSFLMSSCDSYEDLWKPFFECVVKFWHDIPYQCYLNTERKKYVGGDIDVITLNQYREKDMTWSERFRDALLRIPTEYVFLVLDDFFLCDTVKTEYFEELLDIMDADKEIPSIQLYGTRMIIAGEPDSEDGKIKMRNLWPNGWATHFVPTIWRKEVLLKWLRPWESIWGFEGYGSQRARRKHQTESVKVVSAPAVYKYMWVKDCSAVVHGKWLDEKELTDFFETNDVKIDYVRRPKITYEEYLAEGMDTQLKKYSLSVLVKKVFNWLRSQF